MARSFFALAAAGLLLSAPAPTPVLGAVGRRPLARTRLPRRDRGRRTDPPVVDGLASQRGHAGHGAAGEAAHRPRRQPPARSGARRAGGVRPGAGRALRRAAASGFREQQRPLHQLRQAGGGGLHHLGAARHLRERHLHPGAGDLPRELAGQGPLRGPAGLPSGRHPVRHRGRPPGPALRRSGGAPGPESVQPSRDHEPHQRGRQRSLRQPVRGQPRHRARDLGLGAPQRAGARDRHGDRRGLADRTRTPGLATNSIWLPRARTTAGRSWGTA